MIRNIILVLVAILCGGFWQLAKTQSIHHDIEVAGDVEYVRITVDKDGESHFETLLLPFTLIDYAPPAPPISVSEIFEAKNVQFISSPPGWYGEWHPAPRKQIVIILVGELEVQVSDGEMKTMGPGSWCLLEDTSGKGHSSRVVGDVRVLAAAIPLMEKGE